MNHAPLHASYSHAASLLHSRKPLRRLRLSSARFSASFFSRMLSLYLLSAALGSASPNAAWQQGQCLRISRRLMQSYKQYRQMTVLQQGITIVSFSICAAKQVRVGPALTATAAADEDEEEEEEEDEELVTARPASAIHGEAELSCCGGAAAPPAEP